MITIPFTKYQATGNDFIMIDDRDEVFSSELHVNIPNLCDRRFGIGADGLILIRNHPDYNFEMVYFNADGSQSLCGNGSRCAVAFSNLLMSNLGDRVTFLAYDGVHSAEISGDLISVEMKDVHSVMKTDLGTFIDTGSPHLICHVEEVQAIDVKEEGRKLRHSDINGAGGTNVNFVQQVDDKTLQVRTYERGVENETLSCGTGVTAAALFASELGMKGPITILTKGGALEVGFTQYESSFNDIYLKGPAKMVFEGTVTI